MVRARLALPCNAQNGIGTGVEQINGRVHRPIEEVQRHGGPQRQRLGFTNSPGFWRQLADHDVQVRNDKEGGKERHTFDHFRRFDTDGAQQRLQNMSECRFTDPAQAQRRQGDTQLACGQISIELVMNNAQDSAAPAVDVGDGLNPRGAQFDHGEFRRNEKSVEQNQDQSKKNHAEVGEE